MIIERKTRDVFLIKFTIEEWEQLKEHIPWRSGSYTETIKKLLTKSLWHKDNSSERNEKINPETLLNKAEQAIRDRAPSATRLWMICFLKGKVQCIPNRNGQTPEYVFFVITDQEARNGLTPHDWNCLAAKMLTFFERTKS